MEKITNLLLMTLLALCMSLTSCVKDPEVDNPKEKDPDFKYIMLMSDIHVMAPELLEKKGSAYEKYLSQDPKLLEYSGEVLEYLVGETLRRNPDLVIIPGDLTKDGELVSHQLVVSVLAKLRSAGIPVIVVPGNHDIDNPEGSTATTRARQHAHRPSSLRRSMRTSATTRRTPKTLPPSPSSVNR